MKYGLTMTGDFITEFDQNRFHGIIAHHYGVI